MNNIFFTSDLHFNHDKEFIYKPRGFNSVQEMNEAIIERWNKVIRDGDTVFVLGDLMLGDSESGLKCLEQLNGNIQVIIGNHDTNKRLAAYSEIDLNIRGYADILKYKKISFYCSHYPSLTSNFEKSDILEKHVINLYGHTHQTNNFFNDNPFMYHVGVDSHDCYPVAIDTIIEEIRYQMNNGGENK